VAQVNANLPLFEVKTESEQIDRLLFQERLVARLSGFFALLALVLACVGLYGLLSYEVSRRTREIGIRMALGAHPGSVLKLVLRQGIVLAIVGAAAGIAVALAVTRYLTSMLYDVHATIPYDDCRRTAANACGARRMLHPGSPRNACRSPGGTEIRVALCRVTIANCKGLLQAELDGHGQVHGYGFAVKRCGLVFPLSQSVHSCLMQQRGAGNNLHGGHASVGINQRIDEDVARNMLVFGERWICRGHGRNQFCLFDVSANGKRRHGCRRLFVAADEPGVERFCVGLGSHCLRRCLRQPHRHSACSDVARLGSRQ